MKFICQLYLPSVFRSYGKDAVKKVTEILPDIKKAGCEGIYLISLWEDGGYDNGFDVVEYRVNPKFGTDQDLDELIKKAHYNGLMIGVDVVPNHVSDKNILAQNCLNNVPGYEDALYVVSKEEAERLTKAGVPSFFGKLAYSDFGEKYVRSTFADYHQLNLNWDNKKVKEYFEQVFEHLKEIGIDFARIDCGMLLHEDVAKANPENPMACTDPEASIEAIREVSGGMPLFFEWFDLGSVYLFENLPNSYALDCSYVLTGIQNLIWKQKKLIPLLGGHDQMTLVDRGINPEEAIKIMRESGAEYGFLDIPTLIGWGTNPAILPGDEEYDASLENPNERYRARRPFAPILTSFKEWLENRHN